MRTVMLLVFMALCHLAWISDVSGASADGALQLNETIQSYDANRYLDILEDRDGTLTISDMGKPEIAERFAHNDGRIPGYGYTKSVYWAKLELDNRTFQRQWLLNIDQPPMDKIDMYVSDGSGQWLFKRTGDAYPFAEREVRNPDFSFYLDIGPDETKTVFLRFETEGAMIFPVKLATPVKHAEQQKAMDLLMGASFGILVVMSVYNTILAFLLRSRTYAYYVFINAIAALLYASLNGMAYQYLWPEAVWWNNRAIVFFICLAHIAALLFSRNFLKLDRYFPNIHRLFTWFILIELANIAVLFANYSAGLRLAACMLVLIDLTIVGVGVASLWKGFMPARFFMAGWGVFMIGSVLTLLADAGMLPQIFHIRYASQVGSVFEAIVLSLGLAARIQSMRVEKEQAEAMLIQSKQQAESDFLTGLYSRRYIVGQFEALQSFPDSRSFSLLLMDIDFFKRINDTYGHETGDSILKQFAAIIRGSLPEKGIAARFGGEEFVILLPDCDMRSAYGVAERLLDSVRKYPFRAGEISIPCSASIGVAEWKGSELESFESCVRRADYALYEAKKIGRDRVCVAARQKRSMAEDAVALPSE
ncbi:sensor domain-containing diguanylate cyclase [Paenibacillus hemerocallicola]|uniref:sensor domain-containing diguanylate cyclase n=1 Tax=Paenibacillus hemerocallicola TaxID=1172614 RepID=UPI00159ECA50|nr:diguanylate cyclase [Paenibacillus hemerocallicola]